MLPSDGRGRDGAAVVDVVGGGVRGRDGTGGQVTAVDEGHVWGHNTGKDDTSGDTTQVRMTRLGTQHR